MAALKQSFSPINICTYLHECIFNSLKYAYDANKKVFTLFSKIGLQKPEILML